MHFWQRKTKYLYDLASKTWVNASFSTQKFLGTSPEVQDAIGKGLRFLGEQ